ncbi:hypothetical protein NHJ13734_007635 [Beauveria thailandica]
MIQKLRAIFKSHETISTTEKPPVDPDDPQLENGLCQTGSVFGPAEAQPDTSYPEGGRAATVVLLGSLCERLGFAWATRVIGAVTVVLLLVGCVTVRRRDVFADAPGTAGRSLLPGLRVLLRVPVLLMMAGVFFIEWGFFIGFEYVASCALAHGAGRKLSILMIVFLNAGSVFGRWLPGIMADRFGRLNTMVLTNLLCITAMFAIWLPARDSVAAIVLFSVVFGFASGSNVSLVPVCVGEYCTTDNYGRYYTTVYTVVSFGALTGVPIAGPILQSSGGSYTGLVIFVGAAYVAGTACFSAIWVINRVRYQTAKPE